MDIPLPDGPSWEIAAGSMAMDSQTAGVTEEGALLDVALGDAGIPIPIPGTEGTEVEITITPVEWRSAPWIGRYAWNGHAIDVFLFETYGAAEEWARLRVEEELADDDSD